MSLVLVSVLNYLHIPFIRLLIIETYFLVSIEGELKRASSAMRTLSKREKRQIVLSFLSFLLISVLVPKSIAEKAVFLGVSILNINLK